MKRMIWFLLLAGIAQLACNDAGVGPWPGWNTVSYGNAAFSVPPEVRWLEVDPHPRDVVGVWGDLGDTLVVYLCYQRGLEVIVHQYDSTWACQQESISIGIYSGTRLRSTIRPTNAMQSTVIFVRWVGDGDIQLFLWVVYGQGQSAVTAGRILQSLRI